MHLPGQRSILLKKQKGHYRIKSTQSFGCDENALNKRTPIQSLVKTEKMSRVSHFGSTIKVALSILRSIEYQHEIHFYNIVRCSRTH